MGYGQASARLKAYRSGHRDYLFGKSVHTWFTDAFSSIGEMLGLFGSNGENAEIMARYANGTANERIPGHLKLDYVCGMRREVRKQYVSCDDGVYTDVTPFRHCITSTIGAELFDSALDQLVNRRAK